MSSIRIKSIKIKNYRSFGEEQHIVFPDENYKRPVAIVGYNNSGKSNLLNCILYGIGYKFIQSNTFERHDMHNLDFANNILIKCDLVGSEYKCTPYFDSKSKMHKDTRSITGVYQIDARLEDEELKSSISPSMFGMNKHYEVFYINFHNIKEEISTKKTSWGNLSSFLAKHIRKIVDEDGVMAEKQPQFEKTIDDATQSVLSGTKLSDFIQRIRTNYSINLQNNNCDVSFGLPDYEDIFLQMIFRIGLNGQADRLIPIDHFGDGYISMFVMAVIQAIAEEEGENKCLFLFEEPESYLHENHQEYFYKMVLSSLAERGHQVIYTTHSFKMIDIFDTTGIVRLEFSNVSRQSIVKYNNVDNFPSQFKIDENIISLTDFNLYIKSIEPNLNRMLFSRKVVLVEGPNDLLAYRVAIENEIARQGKSKKIAETYLSFINACILVHHGKSTAFILIKLCKHFGLDFFVINDLDLEENFTQRLAQFEALEELKSDVLYLKEGQIDSSTTYRRTISINWRLISEAGIEKIHFNVPKLEKVIGYSSEDKSSLGILNAVNSIQSYSEEFLPLALRNFLELDKL